MTVAEFKFNFNVLYGQMISNQALPLQLDEIAAVATMVQRDMCSQFIAACTSRNLYDVINVDKYMSQISVSKTMPTPSAGYYFQANIYTMPPVSPPISDCAVLSMKVQCSMTGDTNWYPVRILSDVEIQRVVKDDYPYPLNREAYGMPYTMGSNANFVEVIVYDNLMPTYGMLTVFVYPQKITLADDTAQVSQLSVALHQDILTETARRCAAIYNGETTQQSKQ